MKTLAYLVLGLLFGLALVIIAAPAIEHKLVQDVKAISLQNITSEVWVVIKKVTIGDCRGADLNNEIWHLIDRICPHNRDLCKKASGTFDTHTQENTKLQVHGLWINKAIRDLMIGCVAGIIDFLSIDDRTCDGDQCWVGDHIRIIFPHLGGPNNHINESDVVPTNPSGGVGDYPCCDTLMSVDAGIDPFEPQLVDI